MGISATATFRPRSDIGRFIDVLITPAVLASVQASCQLIEERAKQFCPVATGRLRDSITSTVEQLDKTVRGSVGPNTPYAEYVEFGTGQRGAESAGAGPGPYSEHWIGMPAQPYMRPAVDESRETIMEIFRSQIGVALNA
jgi:HK97 gp10 family phage protein